MVSMNKLKHDEDVMYIKVEPVQTADRSEAWRMLNAYCAYNSIKKSGFPMIYIPIVS